MPEWLIRDKREAGRVLHPSTEAALTALQELARQGTPATLLDIGCGSGLLTLAAGELWPGIRITCADISPEAVADTQENLRRAGQQAHVLRSDGFSHPAITAKGPYDLVVCNLLAELLVRFAAEVKAALAPGGCAVLSGILAWHAPQVIEAYRALGFEITAEIAIGDWRALMVLGTEG